MQVLQWWASRRTEEWGGPSDPKDSPPSTGSPSSFPVGATAETWAILLLASCTSVQVTRLPHSLAPLPSHP